MLTDPERDKLIKILSGLYDFTDAGARGRRIFMQQAQLGRFLAGMDLQGSVYLFSVDLLNRVQDWGYLGPEQPTKHSLGALLSYMLTLNDLPPADKAFVARLVVRYALIADPVYIQKLREDYQISEAALREAPPANLAPTAEKSIDPEPSFDVTLENEAGLESIINSEDNFLDVSWLFGALYSALAVCRIEVPETSAKGTGFLVGPDLLLTNHHVLKNPDYVKEAVARFDYRSDSTGITPHPGRTFELDSICASSPEKELDYVLVRLKDKPIQQSVAPNVDLNLPLMDLVLKGWHRGYLVLHSELVKENDRVNIIQHPNGDPMKAVMTQNYVVGDMSESRVRYVADTMPGSSGSPVFNRKWEVVALHHSGKPYPPDDPETAGKKAWKGRYRVNEGVPIRAILEDFRKKDVERLLPRN